MTAPAIAIASMLCMSCVVVSSPSTAAESEGSSSDDGLEPSAFPVWWAVAPASVAVPSGSDAIEIRADTYVIADLSLEADGEPDPAASGGQVTVTFTAGNGGPDPVMPVVVTTSTPEGTTFESATASGAADWTNRW